MKQRRLLIIEGTDNTGCYAEWGTRAPWAVFDPALQDWVTPDLRWRWVAVVMRWLLLLRLI